ncbi:25863_t:CDS:2, partial [Gigaspora margarita]
IQENSKEKILEAQEALRLRAFVLRVAEEEGWNVMAKIPKPTSGETDEFKNMLIEARKQAKPHKGQPGSYYRKAGKRRRYQNQAVFQNPDPSYQTSFNKLLKQIPCYYCGGAGHTASVCASKPGEESPLDKGDYTQGKRRNDSTKLMNNLDQSREVVGKIHEPSASDPERNPKALRIDTGSKDVVGKGGSSVGKTGCDNQSSCTGTKVRRDKSLFKDPVEEKLDDSPEISKHHGQGAEPSEGFCPGTSKNGLGLVARKPGEIQWQSSLEAVIDKDLIRRCLNDGLVRKTREPNCIQKLGRKGKLLRNSKIGSRSSDTWALKFCELVKRILGPNIHRQSYGFEEHLDLRDEMGSVSADRNDIWTTHNKPDGISYEHEVTKVQQLPFLPGLRSGKLLHPKVEKEIRGERGRAIGRWHTGIYHMVGYIGFGIQTPQIVQVVVNNLQFEGKEDYRKSLAITQVLRAIKKEATKDKTPDWPRDPLPVGTLWHYVDAPPTWVNSTMH